MDKKKVAIIGAGASGLPAIKCCVEEGFEPTCFEIESALGGLWYFTEKNVKGRGCVMKSTVLNASKEMMCYSDFLVPKEFPNFMHNSMVLKYFQMYAEQFELEKYIRFNTAVERLERNDDFEETGRWKIRTVEKLSKGNSKEKEYVFDAVIVCTGYHGIKYEPPLLGRCNFKGSVVHTQEYKSPEKYAGKRVAVVGIGSSGADTAVDLGDSADRVFLSTRRGCWVHSRITDKGIPIDLVFSSRLVKLVYSMLPIVFMNWKAEKALEQRFDHALYGLKPQHRPFAQHPMVNDGLPTAIITGKVLIRGGVHKLTERGAIFEDDLTREEPLDAVILATGYKFGFPFLDTEVFEVVDNRVDLYLHQWIPGTKHQTISFTGMVQPTGALMPISELQARWAVRVFSGKAQLPNEQEMLDDIVRKRKAMQKRYFTSLRHTIQVDYIDFMDEVAEKVGCKPNLWNTFFSDPDIAWLCLTGPCTPPQYRIEGPNAWEGARDAVLGTWERFQYPTRNIFAQKAANHIDAFPWISFMVISFIVFFFYQLYN